MGRTSVKVRFCATLLSLFAANGIACELSTTQCAAAQAVAESIMAVIPKDKHVQTGCDDKPFLVTGGDDRNIASSINSAVRKRSHTITIKLTPAVPLSQFPVSVADALSRVQLSGGIVKEKADTGKQSAGPLLVWAGEKLAESVTQAVNALLEAFANQWVTDNYKGYDALLLFIPSKEHERIYNEVKLTCKK